MVLIPFEQIGISFFNARKKTVGESQRNDMIFILARGFFVSDCK